MKSEAKKRVMFQVYKEFYKNLLFQNLHLLIPVFLIGFLAFSVSIPDILRNMPKNDLHYLYTFSVVAIRDTEIFVKVISLAFVSSIFLSSIKYIYQLINRKREMGGEVAI